MAIVPRWKHLQQYFRRHFLLLQRHRYYQHHLLPVRGDLQQQRPFGNFYCCYGDGERPHGRHYGLLSESGMLRCQLYPFAHGRYQLGRYVPMAVLDRQRYLYEYQRRNQFDPFTNPNCGHLVSLRTDLLFTRHIYRNFHADSSNPYVVGRALLHACLYHRM